MLMDADEDECQADNAGCEQTCKNTPGSYTCACTEGFLLESDKHMCTGILWLHNLSIHSQPEENDSIKCKQVDQRLLKILVESRLI